MTDTESMRKSIQKDRFIKEIEQIRAEAAAIRGDVPLSTIFGESYDREVLLRALPKDAVVEALDKRIAKEKAELHSLRLKALDELIKLTAPDTPHDKYTL